MTDDEKKRPDPQDDAVAERDAREREALSHESVSERAAELLGLKRTTFLEKMKRLDLEDAQPDPSEA